MTVSPQYPIDRAALYAKAHGLTIEKQLGGGQDGIVLGTNAKTAVKALRYPQLYRQEKAVYQRFHDRNVSTVNDFQVPRLIDFDDMLMVVEMTVVSAPFILDFAGVKLDSPQLFEPEILAEWEQEKQEQFDDDWPRVKRAMWKLAALGVHLTDVHPGNVRCR